MARNKGKQIQTHQSDPTQSPTESSSRPHFSEFQYFWPSSSLFGCHSLNCLWSLLSRLRERLQFRAPLRWRTLSSSKNQHLSTEQRPHEENCQELWLFISIDIHLCSGLEIIREFLGSLLIFLPLLKRIFPWQPHPSDLVPHVVCFDKDKEQSSYSDDHSFGCA